jgi:hypothetical protein
MTQDERELLNIRGDTLLVYRPGEGTGGFGWTLKKEWAEEFPPLDHGLRAIQIGVCRKLDVIALLKARGEEEIVILPLKVQILKTEFTSAWGELIATVESRRGTSDMTGAEIIDALEQEEFNRYDCGACCEGIH